MIPMVYVIMPVGSDSQYLRRRAAIEQATKALDLDTHFPGDALHTGSAFDLDQARRDLRRSRIVVADLTLERPSCYYEVGLAQALNRRVLLVAEQGTHIHQAHEREKLIFYDCLDDLTARLYELLSPLRPRVREPAR